MAKKQLKITQIKSRIGYSRKAKATLDALGLTKMNKSVILEANDAIVGMIKKIDYYFKLLKYSANDAICSLSNLPAIICITGFSISLFL